MANITLKGNPIETAGDLPALGRTAPDFDLVKSDLSEATLAMFLGKKIVLNIFPSLDTDICAASVRRFNQTAADRDDTTVLAISGDLPFAHARFCSTEGLEDVIPLSTFRDRAFGQDYGVVMTSGPLAGLMSRAVVVLDPEGKVVYTEQVPEIGQEPDYEAALAALG